ncbi:MAG: hypothetical protein GYB66_07840 [Chloroflexi bacterium]|nr:hypothetical protein [Chloroflexota bacterium]
MEWILLSLAIVGSALGTAGGLVYYYHRYYERFIQYRLLQEKQLAIYAEIAGYIGQVKATLEYTSGDETLREWKAALKQPLREMLGKSSQWSIFLPVTVRDLPAEYAGKVAHSLNRLNNLPPSDLSPLADTINEIKKLENEAASQLRQHIRQELGAHYGISVGPS